MMPVDFPGSNIDLVKPENMTDEQCMQMRAWCGDAPDGSIAYITAWKPSKEDIEAFNRGEALFMRTSGPFAPTSMFTFNEEGQPNI